MREIWKDVKDFEGYYQVSNLGNVKSYDMEVNNGHGGRMIKKGRVLKTHQDKNGYVKTQLCVKQKHKTVLVHRLVASAFLENTKGKSCVNHKDFIRSNNVVGNLEWMSHAENNQYSYSAGRSKCYDKKSVIGINQHNGFIITLDSMSFYSSSGIDGTNISRCCNGKQRAYKNYTWNLL